MGRGRDMDADRPVEPDEARTQGNDPDAVELHNGGEREAEESGPRRVGDVREEREGSSTGGRTEGDEHLRDPDAGTNRATSDAGRDMRGVAVADADAQEGWNVPSSVLPPIGSRDLPEPIPVGKLLGASVVILATALGSGEFLIWPWITTQVGIAFLWLAVVGFFMQFVINMEIERYTLATGETAVTGFTRFWKPWGIIFVLGAILPNAFPGWATSGATLFTWLFGFGDASVIASIVLVATALALTLSPVVYQALEKIQIVLVAIIMVFLVVGIFAATELGAWASVVTQAPASVPRVPGAIAALGAAAFLGAVAFAGAGGANNLTQSNYIRDKGLGMGARMPKVVSPITGEEVAAPSLGYTFPVNEENMRRWRRWWKVANREHFITFFLIGAFTLLMLSVLVWSTVGRATLTGEADIEFINEEARILGNEIGGWFRTFFLFAGMVVLFSTSIGIMDYVSRLSASELKISFFPGSQTITESRIYFTLAWVIAIAGSLILLAGLEAPLVLLIISASGGGVVMFFYSGMLIWMNTRVLPDAIKLKGWRLVAMWIIFLIFAVLSVYLVYYQIASNFFGGG